MIYMTKRSVRPRVLAMVLAVLIAAPEMLLAAVAAPELPNPGNPGISKQEQEQVGLKAMGEVYQQMPVLPDSSPVTQYIQQLGGRLAGVIPQQYSWPFQFHVVQQKEINAFALPGGPMFVNIGTIMAADNEAQLAGVMAHEMAHVYMQHSAKMMKQNMGPSILAGLGQILGSMIGGVGGAVAAMGGQITGGLLSMKYSRADEAQADAVGAIIMYKAGYNPKAMADFFRKLEQQGGSGPQMLSDHPNPGNREQAIMKEVQNWPARNYVQSTPQFTRVKQDASKVKAYTGQQIAQMAKSGQIHNTGVPAQVTQQAAGGAMSTPAAAQIQPSGQFQPYQNNVFAIEYPSNWTVMPSQNGSSVTIAPQAGVQQNAIAYGVMISGFQPQAANLDDATQQLISSLEQDNPGLRPLGSVSRISVNGVQGRSVDLQGTSPIQGKNGAERERDWLVTVPMSTGQVLYVIFIAPDPDFSHLRPTFQQMLRSLRLQ
jgi:predicted Zn-dependent protease